MWCDLLLVVIYFAKYLDCFLLFGGLLLWLMFAWILVLCYLCLLLDFLFWVDDLLI